MSLGKTIIGQLRVGNVSALKEKFTCEEPPLSVQRRTIKAGYSAPALLFGHSRPLNRDIEVEFRELEKKCHAQLLEGQSLYFDFKATEMKTVDGMLHGNSTRAELRWYSQFQIDGTTVKLYVEDDNADGALQSQDDSIRLRWPDSYVNVDGTLGQEAWYTYTNKRWELLGSRGSADRKANKMEFSMVIKPVEAAFQSALAALNLTPTGSIGCKLTCQCTIEPAR